MMVAHNRRSSIFSDHSLPFGHPLSFLRLALRRSAVELPAVGQSDRDLVLYSKRVLQNEHTPSRSWLAAVRHGAVRR
jgi:hypothetical protein